MGAFLGAELEFRDESIWQTRLPYTWDEMDRIQFDRANRWWRLHCELILAACEHSGGRYLVAGDGGGALGDAMINLLGSEDTLVATIERPDRMRELRDRMLIWVKEMIDETVKIVEPYQEGSVNWLGFWAPDTFQTFQCDMCVMLSPQQFNDMFLEELRRECSYVDHSFYHLDGTEEMRHLDAILSIEELDGIQWTPEPTVPANPAHFAQVWKRVQESGKKLMFFISPEHVRGLLESIGKEGVFLSVSCKDEVQAQETLRELEALGM